MENFFQEGGWKISPFIEESAEELPRHIGNMHVFRKRSGTF